MAKGSGAVLCPEADDFTYVLQTGHIVLVQKPESRWYIDARRGGG